MLERCTLRLATNAALVSTTPRRREITRWTIPAYVVQPVADGARLVPNGLPVFTLNYGNDDAGDRSIGQ